MKLRKSLIGNEEVIQVIVGNLQVVGEIKKLNNKKIHHMVSKGKIYGT